jgi:hypothetical protein
MSSEQKPRSEALPGSPLPAKSAPVVPILLTLLLLTNILVIVVLALLLAKVRMMWNLFNDIIYMAADGNCYLVVGGSTVPG